MGLRTENTEAAEKAARDALGKVRALKTGLATLNSNKDMADESTALPALDALYAEIAPALGALDDVMTATEVIETEEEGAE